MRKKEKTVTKPKVAIAVISPKYPQCVNSYLRALSNGELVRILTFWFRDPISKLHLVWLFAIQINR